MLRLYNTLTRKKEIFKPIKDKEVGLYSCGPTVYSYQHIGNLRSYIFVDILKRVLEYDGYRVKHVMNITDVGHLTSDADTGEDKVEKAAKKSGKKASEITNYYWKIFKQDFKKLNIDEPDIWAKATEHIKEQIDMIKTLEKKGYTYRTSDGIYFDTSKLKDYGKLAPKHKQKLKAGKRIGLGEKKNITDFALWKFSPSTSSEQAKRQQEWKSPWGIGFPGWHIECSAMSSKYLGKQFDIHTGGEEHISLHHTNEIAQSEATFGKKPWVKYWLHARWLLFKGEKMAKSKGQTYTLSELEKNGFNPLSFRYFTLTAHYRKHLNFTINNLKKAQQSYLRIKDILSELKNDNKINKIYLEKFNQAINDDLNTPVALSILWKLVRDKKAIGKAKTTRIMDKVLGLNLFKKEKLSLLPKIKNLIGQREEARKEKNWKKADELRKKINKYGFQIEDTDAGPKIKKLNK